jgi:hypothetical protein
LQPLPQSLFDCARLILPSCLDQNSKYSPYYSFKQIFMSYLAVYSRA